MPRQHRIATLMFFMLLIFLPVVPLHAADFAVTTAADLIDAINTANATPGADTITLNASIVLSGTPTFAANGENGLPSITSDITIIGNGASILRAGGSPDFRILHVGTGGDLTLDDVVVRGGNFGAGAGFNSQGAGIYNAGNLTLNNSTVRDNRTDGAISTQGGGIYSHTGSSLTLNDSQVINNAAVNGTFTNGGGIYSLGDLVLRNSTISNNEALPVVGGNFGTGGGIFAGGPATEINNSTITGNTALQGGGMIAFGAPGASHRIYNSTFSNNTAAEQGGAILSGSQDIEVYGSTFENNSVTDNNGAGGAIANPVNGDIQITASRFTGNRAPDGFGGAIYSGIISNTRVDGSIFENNSAFSGGALYTVGETIVNDSVVRNNTADRGGGFSKAPSNIAGFTINRTTVSGNSAAFLGGGFYQEGNIPGSRSTILNSTFTGNTASFGGGAIGLNAGGVVEVLYSTIVDNSSTQFANSVGGINAFAGQMTIEGSIIANNNNTDCSATNSSVSGGHNITTGTGGGIPVNRWCSFIPLQPTDQLGTDPLLNAPGDNGNLGQTYTLQPTSPAIDAVPTDCPAILNGVDQRGAPRPPGSCDIGAVAGQAVAVPDVYPEVYFEVPKTTINDEGTATPQTINIIVDNTAGNLPAPGALPLTVFVTARGSATNTVDFTIGGAAPTTFTVDAANWAAPGTTRTLSIPFDVLDDVRRESTETVEFELRVIGPGVLQAGAAQHTVTIIDDEPVPIVADDDDDDDNNAAVDANAVDPLDADADDPNGDSTATDGVNPEDVDILATVETLPQTGESPWWRDWVLMMLGVLVGGVIWSGLRGISALTAN